MGYDNTWIYAEEWAEKVQQILDEPNKFKEICRVEYTNSRVLNNPYLTDPAVISLSRGTAYTFQPVTETNESVTINTPRAVPVFIDRADLAQSTFLSQMEIAGRQAVLLNRAIEAAVYGDHANFTNVGVGDITGGSVADTTQITVSNGNIDDIITHVARIISVASGDGLLEQNGGFFVWRPADFQILRTFMMANGFNTADNALKNGGGSAQGGVDYMGFTHYSSNQLKANHVFAGVKKLYYVGILADTYGQIVVTQDPGLTSGIGITSRVDFQGKAWNSVKPVLFDVNVA